MKNREEKRREWAEFKFRVIAPLVCGEYTREERAIIRRAILSKAHEMPDGDLWQVSERTLREWVAEHKKGGLLGLYDRRRKLGEQFKAIDAKALETAKMLREQMKSRSIKNILRMMSTAYGIDVSKISKTTLNVYLNKLGARKEKDYSDKGAFQHFQMPHINMMWQSDCSDGIWLPDPTGLKKVRKTTLITFIDDASRLCVHGEFHWHAGLEELFDSYSKAATKYGEVAKLYTDNGSIFRSKQWKSACAELGIDQLFSEAGRPPGRGKVERHYLTIQRGFYKEAEKSGLQTREELNEFFLAWLDECYHKEVHDTLKESPLSRWQKEEDLIKRIGPEKLREALKFRYDRKIDFKTSIINLEGQRYQCSNEHSGERVEVRRRFDCQDEIEIWVDGDLAETARLFVAPADIDYSKRPERQPKQPVGLVLESSKKYRLALVANSKNKRMTEIQNRDDLLAETEFIAILEKLLQKQLNEPELQQVKEFYLGHCPFRRSFIEGVLERCLAEKGAGMHIKLYLRRIQETQMKLR